VDATGGVLALASMAGSLYVVAGLLRRVASAGTRWPAGRSSPRLTAAAAVLGCLLPLSLFWLFQGQFRDW
jgi:hypothetical protein